jgi:serine/threonine protein phosphatase PrpC
MGCGRSKRVVPTTQDSVVPTEPLSSTDALVVDESQSKEDHQDDECGENSSEGSGPIGPSLAEQLYRRLGDTQAVFQESSHELCLLGGTRFDGGDDAPVIEEEFSFKWLELSGFPADDHAGLQEILAKSGIGLCCRKGKKAEVPNQDSVLFCKNDRFIIAGVADGHGDSGHWASHWVCRYAAALCLSEVCKIGRLPTEYDLVRIFNLIHEALEFRSLHGDPGLKEGEKKHLFDISMSGSTLSLVLLDTQNNEVLTAWVGDSSCVMFTCGNEPESMKTNLLVPGATPKSAVPSGTSRENSWCQVQSITADHNPRDVGERHRLASTYGATNNASGRVGIPGSEKEDSDKGGLSMTRALGDLTLHSFGVIHKPGHKKVHLLPKEGRAQQCVLCCSDGVWEFFSNEEAAQLIAKAGRENVASATEDLVTQARARWIEQEEDETDDLSAIVIWI